MTDSHFDFFIIGGGQAGIPLAHALADEDMRVALAERQHLGGSCVNFGCTPTKAALASARVAHLARRANDFGLHVPEVQVDFPAVLARARDILQQSRSGLEDSFEDTDNPVLFRGHAQFDGKRDGVFELQIGRKTATADQVVINSGTRTHLPSVEGLGEIDFLDAGNWLRRPELPDHLVLVGASYIGLEMGQFYRRMGSQVTVIGRKAHPLPREDEDVARAVQDLLEEESISFRMECQARSVEERGGQLTIELERDDGTTEEITGTHLFIATGRRPNTDDLGLDTVGLHPDEKGYLDADKRLATPVDGIWAAGDVRGGPMFTHTSYDDFRVLQSQTLGNGSKTTERVVPYGLFTDPQLGRAGLTEEQARKTGKDVRVARIDMAKNGKANEIGETGGFIKVVADADTDRILGAAVLASEGAELVHTYIDLMNADAPYTVIRDAVHIHPTLAEAVQSALNNF